MLILFPIKVDDIMKIKKIYDFESKFTKEELKEMKKEYVEEIIWTKEEEQKFLIILHDMF